MRLLRRVPLLSLLAAGSLALGACGGSGDGGADPAPAQAAGTACDDVTVPGHEAVMLRAEGLECGVAEQIAAAAEGRGRAAYDAQGLGCEPADAPDGDTDYVCTMGDARLTFRYGTT